MALDPDLRAQLLARREIDQGLRRDPDGNIEQRQRMDQENSTWLEAVVRDRGWPGHSLVGEDGAVAAFLLAQHTPDLDRQR